MAPPPTWAGRLVGSLGPTGLLGSLGPTWLTGPPACGSLGHLGLGWSVGSTWPTGLTGRGSLPPLPPGWLPGWSYWGYRPPLLTDPTWGLPVNSTASSWFTGWVAKPPLGFWPYWPLSGGSLACWAGGLTEYWDALAFTAPLGPPCLLGSPWLTGQATAPGLTGTWPHWHLASLAPGAAGALVGGRPSPARPRVRNAPSCTLNRKVLLG